MVEKRSLQRWLDAAELLRVPFISYCLEEQRRSLDVSEQELMVRLIETLQVMEEAIAFGLTGAKSKGGLAGGDAVKMQSLLANGGPLSGSVVAGAIIRALAAAEANAAMGRIVAAPTAGSSGVLPAVLFTLKENKNFTNESLAGGLAVAGSIGMVIASRASLSGASGGCQAECGSAAAMAAGAAVALCGGSSKQVGWAVAIALKNMLGLVCDPVAGLVESPCVKRNAGAAVQALVAADMALAGISSVIPVDEVIDAMAEVGALMPCALKETARGGLAATPTARRCQEQLFGTGIGRETL